MADFYWDGRTSGEHLANNWQSQDGTPLVDNYPGRFSAADRAIFEQARWSPTGGDPYATCAMATHIAAALMDAAYAGKVSAANLEVDAITIVDGNAGARFGGGLVHTAVWGLNNNQMHDPTNIDTLTMNGPATLMGGTIGTLTVNHASASLAGGNITKLIMNTNCLWPATPTVNTVYCYANSATIKVGTCQAMHIFGEAVLIDRAAFSGAKVYAYAKTLKINTTYIYNVSIFPMRPDFQLKNSTGQMLVDAAFLAHNPMLALGRGS